MRTLNISEAASQFQTLVDGVKDEPLAIARDGENIAFLVSPEDYAKVHRAKVGAFLSTLDSIQAEIELRISRGEYTREDLVEFERSLDRHAS